MATITDKKSIHASLSTTTVDRAQLLQFWDFIEVYNGEASGGDDVYITDDGVTDPVAAAEGTRRVAPVEVTAGVGLRIGLQSIPYDDYLCSLYSVCVTAWFDGNAGGGLVFQPTILD